MKKILIVAALVAASALPATTVYAADGGGMATSKPAAVCFFLPLLPDCLKSWKADHDSMMTKVAAPAKTAMAAPMMPAMPACTKAAAGAGHLYDCKM